MLPETTEGQYMALYDSSLPFEPESSGESARHSSGREDDLTHVGEILTESGLPVADTLKDEMFAELMRLTKRKQSAYEDRRRSA